MGTRILIIEDDDDNRESLGLLLESWGYEVELAATGEIGVGMARDWSPHVVVLDLGLAAMSGEEVATMTASLRPRPYVIAFTGFERREEAARAAGCDAYVIKPSMERLAELLAAIDNARRVQARSGA